MGDHSELKKLQKRRQQILERLEDFRREMAFCHDALRRLHEEEDAILLGTNEPDVPAASEQQTERGFHYSDFSKQDILERASDQNASSIKNLREPNRGEGTPYPKD